MVSKVLGHVLDSIESGYVESLDRVPGCERLRRELCDHTASCFHLAAKMRDEHRAGNRPLLAEFLIAPPNVGRAAEARDNPLLRVSGKVKDKIPDAVRFSVRAPPEILLA